MVEIPESHYFQTTGEAVLYLGYSHCGLLEKLLVVVS
jgi:hypothetical protein